MADAGEIPLSGVRDAKPPLELLIAAPRSFCAGVDRAIKIVETALERFGAPVYVRHEIVHNRHVVEGLERRGAVFVDELDECPDDRPVIFSAHGVAKSVHEEAKRRGLKYVDATCPLVSKVHVQVAKNRDIGLQTVMIGHANHPETEGTVGQLPKGEVLFVETAEDVADLKPRDPDRLAYVTQTTLSVDDTAETAAALSERFPTIRAPHKSDICYATTNRQNAVKAIADRIDVLIVIGSPNSSNSRRLVEVGTANGCPRAQLVQRAGDIDWDELAGARAVGLTSGASTPDLLVEEATRALSERFDVSVSVVEVAKEYVEFKIPKELRDCAA